MRLRKTCLKCDENEYVELYVATEFSNVNEMQKMKL